MTESLNTSIGTSVNITKPHTIKTGININQNLLLKQSAEILWDFVIHTDRKLTPTNLILQLKIIKITLFYWLS